ncbi:MAG: hypothetical protein ACT4NY_28510 [Pseudonocardiales bacterium]
MQRRAFGLGERAESVGFQVPGGGPAVGMVRPGVDLFGEGGAVPGEVDLFDDGGFVVGEALFGNASA